jgi:hypothetical protein
MGECAPTPIASHGEMRIVAFITRLVTVREILAHLGADIAAAGL